MSKLQKCTLLKHAMVTADNTKQFILRGCNKNIKRGAVGGVLIDQFTSTMGSSSLYNRLHTSMFLVACCPDMETCTRQRVWRHSQSRDWLLRSFGKTRLACLLLRHLNLLPLAAMGQSYPPPAHPADSDRNQNLASHLQTCTSLNSPWQERESQENMALTQHVDPAFI